MWKILSFLLKINSIACYFKGCRKGQSSPHDKREKEKLRLRRRKIFAKMQHKFFGKNWQNFDAEGGKITQKFSQNFRRRMWQGWSQKYKFLVQIGRILTPKAAKLLKKSAKISDAGCGKAEAKNMNFLAKIGRISTLKAAKLLKNSAKIFDAGCGKAEAKDMIFWLGREIFVG